MISLHSASAPGFDHPLEMLRACHGKILGQCETLKKLAAHLSGKDCDSHAQLATLGILRYFDTAGQFHHQDEEENLFPALRSCTGVDTALLDRLLSEHIVMLAAWNALRPQLVQLSLGENIKLDAALCEQFIGSYSRHIALENAELLPHAATLLSQQQLKTMGQQMAHRRGANYPPQATF